MSSDKHCRLAIDTAYLRLALTGMGEHPTGFAVNIKWARALTPEVRDLIARGDVVLRRSPSSTSHPSAKRATMVVITDQGIDRLSSIINRFGMDFARDVHAILNSVEPARPRKDARRARAAEQDPAYRRTRAVRKQQARERRERNLAVFRESCRRQNAARG